jgi:hypothetical protein
MKLSTYSSIPTLPGTLAITHEALITIETTHVTDINNKTLSPLSFKLREAHRPSSKVIRKQEINSSRMSNVKPCTVRTRIMRWVIKMSYSHCFRFEHGREKPLIIKYI